MAVTNTKILLLRWKSQWRLWWSPVYWWTVLAVCLWPFAYFIPPHLLRAGHHPPVGAYIAVMGGLAAAVTFRKDPPLAEKAAWIVLITLVTIAEIRNLYVADKEQTTAFSKIEGGLDNTKRGLDQTVKNLEGVGQRLGIISSHVDTGVLSSQKAAETASIAVKEISGGDSWGIVGFNALTGANAPPLYHLSISNSSKRYNLRNVVLRIIRMKPFPVVAYPQCNVGTVPADYRGADLPNSCALLVQSGIDYTFVFLMSADNGNVREEMKIAADGKQTTRVTKSMPNGVVKVLKDW